MKNRHLMGALIAFAPVIAIAQVATTPQVGNASESATSNSVMTEPPVTGSVTERDAETNATTNSLDTGTTTPPTTTTTPTPDPVQPKPKH